MGTAGAILDGYTNCHGLELAPQVHSEAVWWRFPIGAEVASISHVVLAGIRKWDVGRRRWSNLKLVKLT